MDVVSHQFQTKLIQSHPKWSFALALKPHSGWRGSGRALTAAAPTRRACTQDTDPGVGLWTDISHETHSARKKEDGNEEKQEKKKKNRTEPTEIKNDAQMMTT